MASYAGTMQMGSQPVAGRSRAMDVCDAGRSLASHGAWHLAKQATPIFTAVPDTNRTGRPRGTP